MDDVLNDRLLARINAVTVSVGDLLALLEASEAHRVESAHQDDGAPVGMYLVARLAENAPDRAAALWFRMNAAVRLVAQDDGVSGWTLPTRTFDGARMTNKAI